MAEPRDHAGDAPAIDELFHRALDYTPAARADWLRHLRDEDPARHEELVELLASHETPGPLDDLRDFVNRAPDLASDTVPEQIGPYRIVELIARGGMGAVYLGQRADGQFEQRVAIKLMRGDKDEPVFREHFLDERRILARIEHPNIARLLDGGFATNGQPYFVMELVEGQPIDEYCAAHALPLRARLALFRTVAQAVHHAHQHLIVHRDIKPANVLVTADGVPKLLDFGIARLVDPDSAAGGAGPKPRASLRLMTPEYASPELTAGERVTTASDVYQLGLVLRRLVMDPIHGTAQSQTVPGDVSLIVEMATREEPARRYASAEQFADDIQRFLDGLPIVARPDTFAYRTTRFVARHRVGIAAAAVAVALLATSAIIATVQARRAKQERDRAEQVMALLTSLFESSSPRAQRAATGATVTVRDVLDRGVDRVRRELRGQPETKAALLHQLARVYRQLGLLEQSRALLTEALELRRATSSATSRDAVASAHTLGVVLSELGRTDSAIVLLRAAVAQTKANDGETSVEYANTVRDLAFSLQVAGKSDEALTLYHRALELHQVLGDTNNTDVARILHNLGWLSSVRGQSDSAETYFRRALALRRQLLGERDPDVTSTMSALVALLRHAGRSSEAEPMAREVLAIDRTIYPPGHAQIGTDLLNIATVQAARHADAEADSLFREAQRVFDALREENPMARAQAQNDYAIFLAERRRFAEAEPLYASALEVYRTRLGETHLSTDLVRTNLAWVLTSLGRPAEAARLYSGTVGRLEAALPVGDSRVGQIAIDYGSALANAGSLAEAERVLRHALQLETAAAPPGHYRVIRAQSILGACFILEHKYAEAESLLLSVYGVLKNNGLSNQYTRQSVESLAKLYDEWGRRDKAAEYRALLR